VRAARLGARSSPARRPLFFFHELVARAPVSVMAPEVCDYRVVSQVSAVLHLRLSALITCTLQSHSAPCSGAGAGDIHVLHRHARHCLSKERLGVVVTSATCFVQSLLGLFMSCRGDTHTCAARLRPVGTPVEAVNVFLMGRSSGKSAAAVPIRWMVTAAS
jgi:hypothetical protein